MKSKYILTIASIVTIVGVITSVFISVKDIIANRYVQYGMFRLASITLQKSLNVKITFLFALLLSFYAVWFLLVETIKCNRNKVLSFLTTIVVFLLGLWRFENFTGYQFSWAFKHFIVRMKDALSGNLPFGYFLEMIKQQSMNIVMLAVGLVGIALLFWLLAKVDWEKLVSIIKIDNIGKVRCVRITAFVLVILLLVLNSCVLINSKINIPEGPNIILLVVDTLRADSLGCYNQESSDTPNIDRFAENAVLFKNSVAQSPMTINSAPCIFCSVYPYEHGYFNFRCVVPYKLNSLAELLKNKGYQTFGISTNPHVSSRNRLDQGFDIFIEDLSVKDSDCDKVNDRFVKWLDNNKQKQFFAMLWYMDPHAPYDPPREYIDKYIPKKQEKELVSDKTKIPEHWRAFDYKYVSEEEKKVSKKLYDGEVNFFDTEFAKLMNHLKQRGLMKNSIIILTSDHGESFWEKKNPLGMQIAGHGCSLYEEQIKIPLIISLLDQQEGKIILEKVQHVDIVPTLLEYAGISSKTIDNLPLRGDSLKSVINGKKLERKYFFSQLITDMPIPYYMECVQTEDLKLISTKQYGEVVFQPLHLQVLDLNPDESEIDVTDENSKRRFVGLERRLLSWEGNLERIEFITEQVKYKSKEEENKLMERLKSLGYVE